MADLPDLDDILSADEAKAPLTSAFDAFLAALGETPAATAAAPTAPSWRVITPPPPASLAAAPLTPSLVTAAATVAVEIDVPQLYAAFASAVRDDDAPPQDSSFAPPGDAEEYNARVWMAVLDGTAVPSPPAALCATRAPVASLSATTTTPMGARDGYTGGGGAGSSSDSTLHDESPTASLRAERAALKRGAVALASSGAGDVK